jgi:hypothetical protein
MADRLIAPGPLPEVGVAGQCFQLKTHLRGRTIAWSDIPFDI